MIEFLAGADQDMRLIVSGRSGIADHQQARSELIRIVRLKLEASRRLIQHTDADAQARSEGARGELQSLSHLAALDDLKSAVELQALAEKNLHAEDLQLAADSRLVLIGFAIESLQNGDEQAPKRIVDLVNGFAKSTDSTDVPALMVMGEARHLLGVYGYDEESKRIRDVIIELYADASDPQVAQMAAQIAGNVQFDAIESLRAKAAGGETISANQWQEAVEALIKESADLQTIQYLAGAALEFESLGLNDLVVASYESLAKHFDDPSSATGREVELAIAARQARQQVIGRPFDPDLPAVDGEPLRISDYRGKVVLMPFWASGFPDSLQSVPQLKAIRDTDPDDVAIVGMNLDPAGAATEEFAQANDLGFDSFYAESSPTAKITNPVAAQFGMVSMPFVAILDQQGRVAAIKLTGRNLAETVQELIANDRTGSDAK